jgi:hypothetical protein
MATPSTDCPGSWRPLPGAQVGDTIHCEVCGRAVYAAEPPLVVTPDPWRGLAAARVQPHWFPRTWPGPA